jgi:hypothetical protein
MVTQQRGACSSCCFLQMISHTDYDAVCRMESFASMYAERGYTTLEIDIAPPASQPATSQALLKHFEDGKLLPLSPF